MTSSAPNNNHIRLRISSDSISIASFSISVAVVFGEFLEKFKGLCGQAGRCDSTISLNNFINDYKDILGKAFSINNEDAEKLAKLSYAITSLPCALKNSDNNQINTLLDILSEVLARSNSYRNNVKNELGSLLSSSDVRENLKSVVIQCNAESFGKFLGVLKKIWQNLLSNRSIRIDRKFSFLLDTCYDRERGKKLAEGLEKLIRDNDNSCNAVALLAAAYAAMLANENSIERLEWLPLAARAAARSEGSGYIPICPGRGDLAAVLYYLMLCCSSCSTPSDAGASGSGS